MVGQSLGEVVAGVEAGSNGLGMDVAALSYPIDLRLTDDGFMYISDHYNHRVLVYPPDGCTAPVMSGSYIPPCVEGIFIATGAICTPQCRSGFTPSHTEVTCPGNGGLLAYHCKREKTASDNVVPTVTKLSQETEEEAPESHYAPATAEPLLPVASVPEP